MCASVRICATQYADGVPASWSGCPAHIYNAEGAPASKVEAPSIAVVPFILRIPASVIVAPDPLAV